MSSDRTQAQAEALFTKYDTSPNLRGTMYSYGRAFQKVEKTGTTDLEIDSLDVTYASTSSKLTLKFGISPLQAVNVVYGWVRA